MTGTPLRVGLVGYGLAGSVFHAPLIAATEGLALDTVVTSNPERQQQARTAFPDVRVAATPDELFGRADELDLIVIASPNRTHVPLAGAALKAGLPVVVDKPVAGTAAEARELAALAEERGLLLSVFQNRRWDNDFLTLRKLLSEGALGDVYRFESRFERWRPQLKGGWRESGDPQRSEVCSTTSAATSSTRPSSSSVRRPPSTPRRTSAATARRPTTTPSSRSRTRTASAPTSTSPRPRPSSARGSASWARRPATSSTASTRRRPPCARAGVPARRTPAGARSPRSCGAASAPGSPR
ncbi:Inositol 2-dehydrogenase/D-chiro-inositol 3-dehydrogenase [Streptomyces griseomycini]